MDLEDAFAGIAGSGSAANSSPSSASTSSATSADTEDALDRLMGALPEREHQIWQARAQLAGDDAAERKDLLQRLVNGLMGVGRGAAPVAPPVM